MACPLTDYGVVTQLEGVDDALLETWAKSGITNIRTLREALRKNLPIEGLDDALRGSILQQLRNSDQLAAETGTTRHLEARAGLDERLPQEGGGGGDVGPPRQPPGGPDSLDPRSGSAPTVMRGARTLIDSMGRFGPNVELRALSSPLPGLRRFFTELMTTSLRLEEDGAPTRQSVNANIKEHQARGNFAAKAAHDEYLRYLIGMKPGEKFTNRGQVAKALAEEAKAITKISKKVSRHDFAALVYISGRRGANLGTLHEGIPGGRLDPGAPPLQHVFDLEVDETLRNAVDAAAREFQRFYVDSAARREQIGQMLGKEDFVSTLDPKTYSPQLWDFDRIANNRPALKEAVTKNLIEKARKLWKEGKLDEADLLKFKEFLDEQIPKYIDAVGKSSYMRLGDDFPDFISSNRAKRERTFGKIVLGEGEGAQLLEPDFDVIAPYLHLDSFEMLQKYLHTQIVDMEIEARFGDKDASSAIKKLEESYEAIVNEEEALVQEGRSDSKKVQSIRSRAESDIQDMHMLVAAMRNTDRAPQNPTSIEGIGNRVLDGLRSYTYTRIGGGMGFASLGDVGSMSLEHGFVRTYGHIVREMTGDFNELGRVHSDADFAFIELTFDDIGRQMGRNLFDISAYPMHTSSRPEKLLKEAAGAMSTLNGIRPWTNIAKMAASREIVDHLVDVGERLSKGIDAGHELETFRAAGLSESDVRAIYSLWQKHGGRTFKDGTKLTGKELATGKEVGLVKKNGKRRFTWLGVENWGKGDQELLQRFKFALLRDVERLVVTPGVEDVPFLMRKPVVATLGMFRKFGMSHTNRVGIPAAQALADGDMGILNGLGVMFGIGATVYMLKELAAKREIPTDPWRIAQEAVVRHDMWGIVGEIDGFTGAFTGGVVSARGFLAPDTFYGNRYMSGDPAGQMLGAGKSTFDEFGKAVRVVAPFAKSTDRDIRAFRNLVPYNRLPYLDWIFDAAEEGAVRASHLTDASKRDRQMEAVQ